MENKRIVTVYMTDTPNPAAMKFETSILLLPDGVKEYFDKSQAAECPLAYQLFDFTGIKNVFISKNFVTLIRHDDIEWYEIQNIMREFIRSYLLAGDPIFNEKFVPPTPNYITNDKPVEKIAVAGTIATAVPSATAQTDGEIAEKIISILDEYVKPAVEGDGGAIDFKSFDEGVVTVTLRGSCNGCPSSIVTLKSGIERLLMQMMPEVTEVVAEG